ncbi:MAG: hypothetical protein IV088_01920 [Hydrogenophaga sp.]|uniref:hypothetical protein n=1 Tax=Hydrogenophaga sp. TaxID=1904254 RepID=UPI0025B89100|nr:hypothetical protein [Hydrogenophaga sp.]MBT9549580.1 hypothetical protein [Hydrogenophaga sp.]
MRTYIGYWLIEPIVISYKDRYDCIPDLAYSHMAPICGLIEVAVFISTDARFVRVMVPNYSSGDESVPDKDDEILSVIESVGTIIRLSFNGEARFSSHVLATTYGIGERHVIEIHPKVRRAALPIKTGDLGRGLDFALSSERNSLLMQLLVDAHDQGMPLQFRYLSLYKVLELLLKNNNSWNYDALNECIEKSGVDVAKPDGTSKAAKNWIHSIRDRCAHYANGEQLGATALDKESMRQISSAIPLLGRIVSIALGPKIGKLFLELVSGTSRQYQLVEAISGRVLSEG